MGKVDTFRDILQTKCPKCREENMFKFNTLNLGKMLKMHRTCPKCGQDLMPEPGFYFGAMYFSYAINVALMVTFGVAYEVLFDPENILITLGSVLIPPLLLAPWNFRISRAIMLYALGGVQKG
ncbi:MAG: DUF983 domain-containing protein [Cytophagales bacterium]|nr:DUF983 domain-containing protein [Cytophagales bacterium]